jgi:hypothetical protein
VPLGPPFAFSRLQVALRLIKGSAGPYDEAMFTSIRGGTG